jgi:hypothetical protein
MLNSYAKRGGKSGANMNTDKVTRVEVIDETGRVYVRHNIAIVQAQFQDNNRTLKLFVGGKLDEQNTIR